MVSPGCELQGIAGIFESGPKEVKELVKRQHQRFPTQRQDVLYVVPRQKGDEIDIVARWILHDASEDNARLRSFHFLFSLQAEIVAAADTATKNSC
jgi:hypothetical protein